VRVFGELGALTAVHDPDQAAAAREAQAHGVPARGLAEILDDPEIDAVAIAAPAAVHASIARATLVAGKHVFVEKPLALDVGEAESLCHLAASAGRVLMVGHLLQYHPAFRALEERVGAGELGRVLYLYSNRLNFGRFRREENILWSFAPHDISMMLSLARSEPIDVVAMRTTALHEVIADVTTTHLAWANGIRGHVFVSWLHPFKEQKLIVVGDRGMAVFDDGEPWERKVAVYHHRVDWRDGVPQPSRAEAEYVEITADEPLRVELAHFLECVASHTTPRTDGWEGVRVLRVLDAAEQSMRITAVRLRTAGPHGPTIHESAYVDEPVEIGAGTRIWHFSHVLAGSKIGRDCSIGQNVMIGPSVQIGDRVKIQNNVSVYEGVTLEDDVFCGPSCVFTNVRTPRAEVDRRGEFSSTVVRRGATIGANATIVCGSEIGEHAMVAAGAVVTSAVEPHALVAGVPARRMGWVSHAGEVLGADLVCPRTGRRYEVLDGQLQELVP